MQSTIEDTNQIRKSIEKTLVKHKDDGVTINQLAKELNFSWITVKRHLQHLHGIGRVDVKEFGGSKIYFLNGKGKWNTHISLSKSHTLFLDTFISRFNEPFLRIKETKLVDGKWKVMGNVIITKDKFDEVIDFLTTLKSEIGGYK